MFSQQDKSNKWYLIIQRSKERISRVASSLNTFNIGAKFLSYWYDAREQPFHEAKCEWGFL